MNVSVPLGDKKDFVIGSDLREFIVEIANSSIKSEILEFIYYNPCTVFSAFLIAKAIRRKEAQVKEALADFVEANILRQLRDVPTPSYTTIENSKFHDLLDRFIRLFNSNNGRELIRSIIEDMETVSRYYIREGKACT